MLSFSLEKLNLYSKRDGFYYDNNGKYEETGEVRPPVKGDFYLSGVIQCISIADADHYKGRYNNHKILRKV